MKLLKSIKWSGHVRRYVSTLRVGVVLCRRVLFGFELSIRALFLRSVTYFLYTRQPTQNNALLCESRNLRILLLRFRYRNGCAYLGESQGEENLSDSIRTGLDADLFEYFYDLNGGYYFARERNLVTMVNKCKPDLIILSSYSTFRRGLPHFEVIRFIRRQCEIPMIAVWWDSTGSKANDQLYAIESAIDLNILIESSKLSEEKKDFSRFLRLWAPINHHKFSPATDDRDIPVSFVGSTGSYRSIRSDYLNFLTQQGIPLLLSGYDSGKALSESEFASVLRRSKISINFSHSVEDTHQMKGRVLEVLFSGALLLESRNLETPQFFKPGVHYVEFDSKEDLAAKIFYYLTNQAERERISQQGRNWALANYTQHDFWRLTMDRLYSLNALCNTPVRSEIKRDIVRRDCLGPH